MIRDVAYIASSLALQFWPGLKNTRDVFLELLGHDLLLTRWMLEDEDVQN